MADMLFTVSQITEYINRKFFQDPFISAVKVVGEVTNFSLSSVGHAFFSLKDENSMIGCVVYDYWEHPDRDVISDGALLTVGGRVTFYRKSGTIQLAVESAALQGVGDLFARFERTKKRLAEEGLFDAAHKKPLPLFPTHIGVVTSTSGAVMYDIINVARAGSNRHPYIGLSGIGARGGGFDPGQRGHRIFQPYARCGRDHRGARRRVV